MIGRHFSHPTHDVPDERQTDEPRSVERRTGERRTSERGSAERRTGEARQAEAEMALVRREVRRVAARLPASVDREDLLSAGLLGLAQARRSFCPERGVPFEAHARRRVTGAILDDLRALDSMSRGQRAATRRVIEACRGIDAAAGDRAAAAPARYVGGTPVAFAGIGAVAATTRVRTIAAERTVQADRTARIAERSGLSVAEVRGVLDNLERTNGWRRAVVLSDPGVADRVPADDGDPAEVVLEWELRRQVRHRVSLLPPRLRHVVEAVYFEERQMQVVAEELGVTPSRVSQMCAEALRHLHSALREPSPALAG